MKMSVFFIILFLIFGCSTEPEKLLFNVDQLDNLVLENMDIFWKGETINKNTIKWFLDNPKEFLEGLELNSDNGLIFIYVFESKESAIKLTEEYRNSIAMYTEEKSDHSIIKERWWGQPNSNRSVFVNKFNTLILVTHRLDKESNLTQYVALEIMNRIEEKSE